MCNQIKIAVFISKNLFIHSLYYLYHYFLYCMLVFFFSLRCFSMHFLKRQTVRAINKVSGLSDKVMCICIIKNTVLENNQKENAFIIPGRVVD